MGNLPGAAEVHKDDPVPVSLVEKEFDTIWSSFPGNIEGEIKYSELHQFVPYFCQVCDNVAFLTS